MTDATKNDKAKKTEFFGQARIDTNFVCNFRPRGERGTDSRGVGLLNLCGISRHFEAFDRY